MDINPKNKCLLWLQQIQNYFNIQWFSTFIINVLLHCQFFLVLLFSFKKWIKLKLYKCMSHHVTLIYNTIDTASINDTIY